jgi:hypothetical protein
VLIKCTRSFSRWLVSSVKFLNHLVNISMLNISRSEKASVLSWRCSFQHFRLLLVYSTDDSFIRAPDNATGHPLSPEGTDKSCCAPCEALPLQIVRRFTDTSVPTIFGRKRNFQFICFIFAPNLIWCFKETCPPPRPIATSFYYCHSSATLLIHLVTIHKYICIQKET